MGKSQNGTDSFPSLLLALLAVGGLIGLGTVAGWKYRDTIHSAVIKTNEQFDSSTGRDIFDFVTRNPGTNMASIVENLAVSQSTVEHHLRDLTADGYLDTQSVQGSSRYFVAGSDGRYDGSVVAAFRNEALRELINTLHQHGPLSEAKLSEITETDQSTILRQLDVLEESGIIDRVRDGNRMKYELIIDLPSNN
ncbi:winged helix-turn-helix transcriptional regulator [Haladaptatus sp. NG-WS-4]